MFIISFEAKAARIKGNNTFYDFDCWRPSKAITFDAGTIQTVEGDFPFTGVLGENDNPEEHQRGQLVVYRPAVN
jgi:hypothetical protein